MIITDKKLRKISKIACNGNQHAMRYNVMLSACFKAGEMIVDDIISNLLKMDTEIDSLYPLEKGYEDENAASKKIRDLIIEKLKISNI